MIVKASMEAGACYGVKKCAEIVFRKGKMVKSEGLQVLEKKMHALDPDKNEMYKFLGCEQGDGIDAKCVIERVKADVRKRLEQLIGKRLNAENLMKAINCRVIPVARYVMNMCTLGKGDLEDLDMRVKSVLRREGLHGRQSSDECYDCKPTRIFLPYSQPSHSYYHISFVIFMPPTINILHESLTILHQPHFHIKTFILVYWLLLRIGCFITFTFSQLKFDFIDLICCYPKYYNERLYTNRKAGSRGLKSFREVYDETKTRVACYMAISTNEWIFVAFESDMQKKHTSLKREAETARRKVDAPLVFDHRAVIINENKQTEWKADWQTLKRIFAVRQKRNKKRSFAEKRLQSKVPS